MFTDIVGYTALTQADESRTMQLLDRHNRLVRPFFPRYHGTEVKTMGDSFLVEFGSALDALRCAVDIQLRVHDYNTSSPDEWKIMLRIGVHLGDVIHVKGDVFGDAVNISSRIVPLAEPGGVIITRQVYDQVNNKFEHPLVSEGEKELKNVNAPAEVYRVLMPWDEKAPTDGGEARRVAVLPFTNLSPDPADEYFADGMTEELISTVSRIDGTEVISRTSVMQYKKSPKTVRQISSELDAGTVLEGSIRKSGNRLRVSVQMIDAVRDRHLWAESYDRNMDDVFAIQSDIAGRVAEALKAKMAKETPKSAGLTDDVGAYTDYLRGKQLLNEGGDAGTKKAISLLESAVAKDPNFAKAYAELAHGYRHMGMYQDYTATTKRAEEMGRKAVEVGPEVAETHAAMAAAHIALDRFEPAREELETAIRLNPNLSDAHALLGEINGAFGKLDEAIACYRKAYALDPVSMYSAIVLSEVLRASGNAGEAVQVLGRMSLLYPNNLHVTQSLSSCYKDMKDYASARKVLEEGLRIDHEDSDTWLSMAMLDVAEGKKEEALDIMKRLQAAGGTVAISSRLFVNAALGNIDDAFSALDELAQIHAWPFLVTSEPVLAPMHKDPRFAEFCRKVGIPPRP